MSNDSGSHAQGIQAARLAPDAYAREFADCAPR
jgi:glutamate synthase (NADPH/NADH) small chain